MWEMLQETSGNAPFWELQSRHFPQAPSTRPVIFWLPAAPFGGMGVLSVGIVVAQRKINIPWPIGTMG